MDPALTRDGQGVFAAMVTDAAEWYVQKGARVQGPFSAAEVGRFLMLGRVRRSDRVSRDGELWEPVTQVPELVPEALLDLDSPDGWNRFADARAAGDERGTGTADARALAPREANLADADGERDLADVGPGIRVERRDERDMLWRVREEWRRADASRPAAAPEPVRVRGNLLPWSLLGLTLAALAVVLWFDRAAPPLG